MTLIWQYKARNGLINTGVAPNMNSAINSILWQNFFPDTSRYFPNFSWLPWHFQVLQTSGHPENKTAQKHRYVSTKMYWVQSVQHVSKITTFFHCKTVSTPKLLHLLHKMILKIIKWEIRSLYRRFPDNQFPGQTFPGQVILRNFQVHNVCKYQLYRPSQMICMYMECLLMCACRLALSIRELFGKSCSPTIRKV